jgi:hypothetical protein
MRHRTATRRSTASADSEPGLPREIMPRRTIEAP